MNLLYVKIAKKSEFLMHIKFSSRILQCFVLFFYCTLCHSTTYDEIAIGAIGVAGGTWPISDNGGYGYDIVYGDSYNNSNSALPKYHAGIDIAVTWGGMVKSNVDGEIIKIKPAIGAIYIRPRGQAGTLVYMHLQPSSIGSSLNLVLANNVLHFSPGLQIQKGDPLGSGGNTGLGCTGTSCTHLHVEWLKDESTSPIEVWSGNSGTKKVNGIWIQSVPTSDLTYDLKNLSPLAPLTFSPISYDELINSGTNHQTGQLSISAAIRNNYPGEVMLMNGPQTFMSSTGKINISSSNWVTGWTSTAVHINLFSLSALGNTVVTGVAPLITEKFLYPVKIEVIGGADPFTGIKSKLGESYYPFRDVKPEDAFTCYIMKLWRSGVANGQNGLFRPTDQISRIEFLQMAMRAGIATKDFVHINDYSMVYFQDINFEETQKPFVNEALARGIVMGSLCTPPNPVASNYYCFNPAAPVTRSEAVKMLVKTFGLVQVGDVMDRFSDAPISIYPELSIATTTKGDDGCGLVGNIVDGYDTGKNIDGSPKPPIFKPLKNLTRGEAAKLIGVAIGSKKP